MRVFRSMVTAFAPAPEVPRETEAKKRRSDRRIVGEHSNGNIFLQTMKYSTREQIEKLRERVSKMDFA